MLPYQNSEDAPYPGGDKLPAPGENRPNGFHDFG
jgi:hypothetical protein